MFVLKKARRATIAVASAGVLTLLVTACSQAAGPTSEATGDFDWKRFDGETLSVYIADTGQAETLNERLPEFEELTGIDVEVETADVTSYRQNLPVRLTARASDFDVMATFPEVDGPQFAANGWYVPLDDFIENPSITNPDYDFADFPEGVRNAMRVDDETVTVLWEMQTDLVYYRKDLLEQAGLEVPTTFEEWEAAAAAIHDPANETYGFALRGIPYQTTTPFSSFLYAHCGTWTADGKATIDSPEAIDAFETYGRWGEYGPPGMTGFDWPVPSQQFAQGKVFAFLDVNLFVGTLENPAESTVVGNVGYAPVPEGECGRAPFIGGWGYAISPFSKKADAAWYFMQWATSPEMNLELKLDGWPSPRESAWSSSEFTENDPTPEFTEVVLESTRIANARMNPPVAPGVQAREIAGLVSHSALDGLSRSEIEELAAQQNAELQQLIDAMP
jgi:multiple sugar transport system substrate-binding protein